MEEEMPELVDDDENDDSGTSGEQQSQPLITFGQVQLNNMGPPLKILVEVLMSHLKWTVEILGIPLQTHIYS